MASLRNTIANTISEDELEKMLTDFPRSVRGRAAFRQAKRFYNGDIARRDLKQGLIDDLEDFSWLVDLWNERNAPQEEEPTGEADGETVVE